MTYAVSRCSEFVKRYGEENKKMTGSALTENELYVNGCAMFRLCGQAFNGPLLYIGRLTAKSYLVHIADTIWTCLAL